MLQRILLLLCALIFLSSLAFGQNYFLKSSLKSFIDNREFFNPYQTDQTFIANRLNLSLNGFYQNQHLLSGGISLRQDFGSNSIEDNIDLQLYYKHHRESLTFTLGAIPWQNAFRRMPAAFIYDSLDYYKNNLEGLSLTFYKRVTFQEIWLDWTQKADSLNAEQFVIGHSGSWKYKLFVLDHYGLFTHRGFSLNPKAEDFIQDEATAQISLGLDLSRKFRFDSLRVRSGLIVTKDRARPLDWRTRSGWISELGLRYDWLGFNTLYYQGEGLKNSVGDPFYHAKSYSRSDLMFRFLNRPNLFLEFKYSLHITEGIVDHQQSLNLKFSLDAPIRR